MPILTVRDGARSVVRDIDRPTNLDAICPSPPPVAYSGEWQIRPEGSALALVSPDGERYGTLAPGESLALGDLTLGLPAETPIATSSTERLPRESREPLSLVLPPGRRIPLGTRTLTVGKSPKCDIVVRDPTVSEVHCRIVPMREGWEIRDAGSTNGTRVGGVRVASAMLVDGIAVVLGRTRILCSGENTGVTTDGDGPVLVGESAEMESVRQAIDRYANSPHVVLIQGETGSGKDIVAKLLHARSNRARGPYVAINAAAIAPELVESELFGHERGAFTGAANRRRGVFEEASGGTLFLDELGELPLAQQAKLLRVIETREIRRVGGEGLIRVDTRVVCATHRDLAVRAAEGAFRMDLRYRLDQIRIRLPPLRERTGDIPTLARHLLTRIASELGRPKVLEDHAIAMLVAHDWPGNVRELYAVLCRAANEADSERVGPEHIEVTKAPTMAAVEATRRGTPLVPPPMDPEISRDIDGSQLCALYETFDRNLSRVARATGLSRSTVRDRMRRAK